MMATLVGVSHEEDLRLQCSIVVDEVEGLVARLKDQGAQEHLLPLTIAQLSHKLPFLDL